MAEIKLRISPILEAAARAMCLKEGVDPAAEFWDGFQYTREEANWHVRADILRIALVKLRADWGATGALYECLHLIDGILAEQPAAEAKP